MMFFALKIFDNVSLHLPKLETSITAAEKNYVQSSRTLKIILCLKLKWSMQWEIISLLLIKFMLCF